MRRVKQTWEEEHEEVVKCTADLRFGSKWTFGFFQVVPDTKQPDTRLSNNSIEEFLVPEHCLSLKLYFDNFRNYGICAAFIALGAWAWGQSPQKLPLITPTWLAPATAIAIWVLTGVLLLLNCAQAWILTRELYRSLRAIHVARFYVYRGNHIVQMVLSTLHILITWAADIILSITALLVAISIIAISIGFVAYTVFFRQGLQ